MSQGASFEMRQGLPGEERLGVMDALGHGWALLRSDFWPLWTVGLVMLAIEMACGLPGAIPYIGGCISLAISIFVVPPLAAGLFLAVRRRIDGARADVNTLFDGFRQRYWQSVVAMLLPTLLGLAAGVLIVGMVIAIAAISENADEEVAIVLAVILGFLALVVLIGVMVFSLFFTFSLLYVWEYPQSGWEAAKASMRLVKQNFWSVFGYALLCGLIGLGAYIAGALACCVGVFFTMPAAAVWLAASTVYLYRSWTGQPLVQPIGAAGAAAEGGPIPPTSIEPPAGI